MTNICVESKNNRVQDIIETFQNYMLSPKNMMNISNNLKSNFIKSFVPEKKKAKESNIMRQKMFIPGKKDHLFWIFYILKYGFDDYNLIGSNEYVYEKEVKLKYIDKIRDNKALLRQNKFNKLSTCEDDLINEEVITLKTFQVLCVLEKISYCFVSSNIIFCNEFDEIDGKEECDEDIYDTNNKEKYNKINVIHKTLSGYFALEIDGFTMISNYRKNKYRIDNLEKPIKAIGNYSVTELKTIMQHFNLSLQDVNGKYLTKQKIYDIIYEKLNSYQ